MFKLFQCGLAGLLAFLVGSSLIQTDNSTTATNSPAVIASTPASSPPVSSVIQPPQPVTSPAQSVASKASPARSVASKASPARSVASKARERKLIEEGLKMAKPPSSKDVRSVRECGDTLADVTGIPRYQVMNTPIEDLADKVRVSMKNRGITDSEGKIAALIDAMKGALPIREFCLSDIERSFELQRQYHDGQRLSDEEISFLHHIILSNKWADFPP